MTVNTLLKESEIGELFDYIKTYGNGKEKVIKGYGEISFRKLFEVL